MRALFGSFSLYWLFCLILWGLTGHLPKDDPGWDWDWAFIYVSVACAVDGVRNEWLKR